MDIQEFERRARDPRRTRIELENMKANAAAKGAVEYARIADEVLRERFPIKAKAGGGATPTVAKFQGRKEDFDSGKEAYLWLVEQFRRCKSDALDGYVALNRRGPVRAKGVRFAREPDELFPAGSSRRGNPAYYAKLGNGWYADTNLSHKDKFAALMQLSYVCGLEYETAWDFRVSGATAELLEHQEAVIHARKLLDELLAL